MLRERWVIAGFSTILLSFISTLPELKQEGGHLPIAYFCVKYCAKHIASISSLTLTVRGSRMLTVIYCCVTNYPKIYWLKQQYIFFLTISWDDWAQLILTWTFPCGYSYIIAAERVPWRLKLGPHVRWLIPRAGDPCWSLQNSDGTTRQYLLCLASQCAGASYSVWKEHVPRVSIPWGRK